MTTDRPPAAAPGEGRAAAPAEALVQVGALARQLHEALAQLGLTPQLQRAASGLPEARSGLNYVADKTFRAADKVLDTVDAARVDQATLAARARALAAQLTADPQQAVAAAAVLGFVGEVEAASARIDRHLTEIMLAQDFQDLTGQVVAKVVVLASELETSLLALLMQTLPPEQKHRAGPAMLAGPVVDPARRAGVVTGQAEVDELLSSLGL